jgi:hypothetical protein
MALWHSRLVRHTHGVLLTESLNVLDRCVDCCQGCNTEGPIGFSFARLTLVLNSPLLQLHEKSHCILIAHRTSEPNASLVSGHLVFGSVYTSVSALIREQSFQ